jgi:hypothetical protein
MPPSEGFWCPTSVDTLDAFVRRGIPKEDVSLEYSKAFVRNIAYNLQYLEYLNHVLTEKSLHVTVFTLTIKTFVVTGMSVVEAVLWYVLKKYGLQRKEEWEQAQELESRTFQENCVEYKLMSTLVRKLKAPIDAEMPLDAMIKRVESKKLLGVDVQVYKNLNYLRKLRNRVHIHSVQHDKDTDWWSFNEKELKLMKAVLGSVLCSELFAPAEEHDEFLAYLRVQEKPETLVDDLPF